MAPAVAARLRKRLAALGYAGARATETGGARQGHPRVWRRSRRADLLLDEMLVKGPIVLQEFCPGVGVRRRAATRRGAPFLVFQHVRLHEPLHGGGSSYRRDIPVSPELLDAALRLLGALRYAGKMESGLRPVASPAIDAVYSEIALVPSARRRANTAARSVRSA